MGKFLVLVVAVLLVVFSCTSANDAFLIKALDDQSKAQALTNQGVQQYELHLAHPGLGARASSGATA